MFFDFLFPAALRHLIRQIIRKMRTLMIVHLLAISNNYEKIFILTRLAARHIREKEPLLIVVPNEKSLVYVDELLWKEPNESFIPHITSRIPTSSLITITICKENLNN